MQPFIHFRSENSNGDITLTFDMSAKESRQLLRKLASMGALSEDTIEQLKRKQKL